MDGGYRLVGIARADVGWGKADCIEINARNEELCCRCGIDSHGQKKGVYIERKTLRFDNDDDDDTVHIVVASSWYCSPSSQYR